jgi:hypothetical protein
MPPDEAPDILGDNIPTVIAYWRAAMKLAGSVNHHQVDRLNAYRRKIASSRSARTAARFMSWKWS